MNAGGSRAERQGANLVRHLNERYADTVLFLARRAAHCPQADSAELLTIGEGDLSLSVQDREGTRTVRVPLPSATPGATDVRGRVKALLEATRAEHPDDPMTSLESARSGPAGLHARMAARHSTRDDG